MTTPIPDLKDLFGDRYRVETDESYYAETGSEIDRNTDPWLWIIPCRNGHICPWKPDQLAAVFGGHRVLSLRLVRRGFPLLQDGDDGRTIGFRPDQFDEVAEIIKPYRRRQVSEMERERLRAIGFKPARRTVSVNPAAKNASPANT